MSRANTSRRLKHWTLRKSVFSSRICAKILLLCIELLYYLALVSGFQWIARRLRPADAAKSFVLRQRFGLEIFRFNYKQIFFSKMLPVGIFCSINLNKKSICKSVLDSYRSIMHGHINENQLKSIS